MGDVESLTDGTIIQRLARTPGRLGAFDMTKTLTASVTVEDGWYVAQCLEVDVASQGESEAEALLNLKEALELSFEPPTATPTPRVLPVEIVFGAA